ncbi:hypothetical protein BDA96_10G228300 [Sorghum bicolor]|uniref:Uncharacterized protein n=2 Tax=Sorghum bicolor TaxID=4558 RepID=A0A921Q686_SORBI|nr:hypothetical protein BDA96_10G228300 [Sorghum bicolor]OQU76603.1 hypothetical protein SORBI_3010G173201 [Sorghum bicolor]
MPAFAPLPDGRGPTHRPPLPAALAPDCLAHQPLPIAPMAASTASSTERPGTTPVSRIVRPADNIPAARSARPSMLVVRDPAMAESMVAPAAPLCWTWGRGVGVWDPGAPSVVLLPRATPTLPLLVTATLALPVPASPSKMLPVTASPSQMQTVMETVGGHLFAILPLHAGMTSRNSQKGKR